MATDYSIYRELVTQLMQGEESLPSLPNLTFQIRSVLSDPNANIQQLEKLIISDPSLSALILKHANSVLYRKYQPPNTLADAIRTIGLDQLGSIVVAHSLKSLFIMHNPTYKRIFVDAWRRLIMKSATASILAMETRNILPDHALLASLLSEIGSLVLLSAFRTHTEPPSIEQYARLCQEFSKSLGVIVLKSWHIGEEYVQVVRQAGDWQVNNGTVLDMTDLVNLSLYHAITERDPAANLPALDSLPAYRKLPEPLAVINDKGHLDVLDEHQQDIANVARTLRS